MLKITIDTRNTRSAAAQELADELTAWLQSRQSTRPGCHEVDIITPAAPVHPVPAPSPAPPASAPQQDLPGLPLESTRTIIIDRIDFVPTGSRCGICHRPLSAGAAYIVRSGDREYPCGPSCLGSRVPGYKDMAIPDFTRASVSAITEGGKPVRKKSTGAAATPEEEYLKLRCEMMSGFRITPFPPLSEVATRYRSGGKLTPGDRAFVARIMGKVGDKKPELAPGNLQACYAFDFFLGEAVRQLAAEKRGYLEKLRADLRRYLSLSAGQVAGANRWFAKLEGCPELDAGAFAWAEKREGKGVPEKEDSATYPRPFAGS